MINNATAQHDSVSNVVSFEAVYSSLPWYNLSGGKEQGFVYMDNMDVTAQIDFDKLFNVKPEVSFFAYGLGNHGGRASALMGDFQIASNIEAIDTWRLFECWAQVNFLDGKLSTLIGLYDLNSEFDILTPGTLFVNSSFGIGAEYAQSGLNGPSIFPISSLGLRVSAYLSEHVQFRAAIFDAVPGDPNNLRSNEINLSAEEGALISGEISILEPQIINKLSSHSIEREHDTRRRKVGRGSELLDADKINIGAWYYTADFNKLNDSSVVANRNFGVYIGAQKYFSICDGKRNLATFIRLGYANPDFNRFGSALSGGLVYKTAFISEHDSFGLAFSSGINGSEFQAFQEDSNETTETVLELTYSMPLKPWLMLQPDLQYVINPSTQMDLQNPFSAALLVQISLVDLAKSF